jgi:outer membrane protein assembly factor BamB
VIAVTSQTGLHLIDTRILIPPSSRNFYTWQPTTGGIVSSPVFVAFDTSAPKEEDHGPAVYVTTLDQHVYKLALKGDCNGQVSEPCIPMTAMVVWRKHIEFTTESEPFYTLQDYRCTEPFKVSRTADLQCVKCKRQLPCSQRCLECEDQTVGGYNPLRSSPVLYGEMLYVIAWDGLHALRRSNGERAWHYFIRLDSQFEQDERFYAGTSFHRQRLMALSCVVLSDVVVFPSASTVVCVNRKDGSLKWRVQHPRIYDYISTPVVHRLKDSTTEVILSYVYIDTQAYTHSSSRSFARFARACAYARSVLHVHLRTCTKMQHASVVCASRFSLHGMQPQGDAILISSMDGSMYCLDLDTGSTLWSYRTGVENVTQALAPVVDSYSNIFLLEKDKLTALDKSGKTLWNEVCQNFAMLRPCLLLSCREPTWLEWHLE